MRRVRRRDTRRALARERDEARGFLARALDIARRQHEQIALLEAERDAMTLAADSFRAERNRLRRQMAMCAGMPPDWVMVATRGTFGHTLARTHDQHPPREPENNPTGVPQ